MTTQSERVQQTKDNIIQALIHIGKKKPLTQITVSDITRTSKISRGTFYLHYLDRDDLIEQVEAEIINKFQTIIKRDINGTMDYDKLVKGEPYDFVINIVAIADKNREVLHLLFGANGDPTFYAKITDILKEAISKDLIRVKGNSNFSPEFPLDYALRLIVNTIMTVINTWLGSNDHLSQQAISKLIMRALYLSPYEILDIRSHTLR